MVDADEIAFIQTVRLVDTATGANKDPEETNKKRQTGTATSVDRLGGREQGWYGMTDAGGGGSTLRTWTKADPTKPAFLMDRPSWNVGEHDVGSSRPRSCAAPGPTPARSTPM